jgi:hypothetical protein
MKVLNTLVLTRADINEIYKNTPSQNIRKSMFTILDTGILFHEDFIIFIDDQNPDEQPIIFKQPPIMELK